MYDTKKAEWKITRAFIMLDCMRLVKEDFQSNSTYRKRYGARNFLIYNNSVTQVLHNLKSVVGKDAYTKWYSPYGLKLSNDKILRKIYKMRSETLKEGETHFGIHGQSIIVKLDSEMNHQETKIEGEQILELWDLKEVSGKSTIECMDYSIDFFDKMLKDAINEFIIEKNIGKISDIP